MITKILKFFKLSSDLPPSDPRIDEFFQAEATKSIPFPNSTEVNDFNICLYHQNGSFRKALENLISYLEDYPEEEAWIESNHYDIILHAVSSNNFIELEIELEKKQIKWLRKFLKKNFPLVRIKTVKIRDLWPG